MLSFAVLLFPLSPSAVILECRCLSCAISPCALIKKGPPNTAASPQFPKTYTSTPYKFLKNIKQKTPHQRGFKSTLQKAGMRPTTIYSLSAELGANTIDPYELNCRVRNGNGCGLVGIIISLIPASCKRTNFKRNLSIATGSFHRWKPSRRD